MLDFVACRFVNLTLYSTLRRRTTFSMSL